MGLKGWREGTGDSAAARGRGPLPGPAEVSGFGTRSRSIAIAAGVAIVLMTAAAYTPAYRNGFAWDDDDYVTQNPALKTAEGLRRIWLDRGATPQYYPLVFTSFWIEYHLWGLWPAGYHAVNIMLHAAGAVLLWLILRKLSLPGAWFAAAVFALHPVHVESVAWITERKNVLSGVFYLAAALAYLRWHDLRESRQSQKHHQGRSLNRSRKLDQSRDRKGAVPALSEETAPLPLTSLRYVEGWRSRLCYEAAAALFVCALLSKTVTCTLPAALLLIIWWKRGRIGWSDVAPLVPLMAIGVILGLNTIWMEKHRVGAQGEDWGLTFVERCLVAGRAVWFYLGKLIWPAGLTFIYPRWVIDSTQAAQYAHLAGTVGLLAVLWRLRRRIGRGPLAAALFFGGTLLPALGFANTFPMLYSFVADHFQYLASIGPIVVIVASAAWLGSRTGRVRAGAMVVVGVALLACLGVLTWKQCYVYKDAETLWRDILSKYPDTVMARINLAHVLENRGEVDEAVELLTAATRIDPRKAPPTVLANAHFNLASLVGRQGRLEEAVEHFREALRIQPRYPRAHYGLGCAYHRLGMLDAAIAEYRLTPGADPNYREAQKAMQSALAAIRRQEGGE